MTLVQSDPPSAYLSWRNEGHALALQPSGSGSRYEASYDDGLVSLWMKGTDVKFRFKSQPELDCKIEMPG